VAGLPGTLFALEVETGDEIPEEAEVTAEEPPEDAHETEV